MCTTASSQDSDRGAAHRLKVIGPQKRGIAQGDEITRWTPGVVCGLPAIDVLVIAQDQARRRGCDDVAEASERH
jgi:hypothetical protein